MIIEVDYDWTRKFKLCIMYISTLWLICPILHEMVNLSYVCLANVSSILCMSFAMQQYIIYSDKNYLIMGFDISLS